MNEADDERVKRPDTPSWIWIVVLAAAVCAFIAYIAYMALGMPGMDHGYGPMGDLVG